ncbi:MAG: hypothetical protein E6Q61_09435 [Nitrosomonas sp.]|nr:MAG: hypothetical protein E6Q61_09435 [Nitrosomonas sp.]
MEISIFEVISTSISILLLIWFFNKPWQSLIVDWTRQKLFEIRDSVFDYAANGEMDFNSEEYIRIRNYLNSAIRNCHQFTWYIMFASDIASKYEDGDYKSNKSVFDITNQIDDVDLRIRIKELLNESNLALGLLIALRSPLFPIILIMFFLKRHYDQSLNKIGRVMESRIRSE